MSIQKCKRKLALCIATLFWAACDNDSSSSVAPVPDPETNASNDVSSSSESQTETPSSSSEIQTGEPSGLSSSSEEQPANPDIQEPASSSSEIPSSSSYFNPDYPYTLGLHPSVHCKDSTFYTPSPCASYRPNLKTVMAELSENEALYGVPPQTCTIPARNDSIFKCDNGMIYFKKMAYASTKSFALVGDTIEQCAPTAATNGEACPSAKEYFTNQAENAEASTNYPNKYTLADNTTLNCKDAYKTKLDTVNANGAKYDHWINEHKQKCDDGNEYTTDELMDLVSKQNSAKPD